MREAEAISVHGIGILLRGVYPFDRLRAGSERHRESSLCYSETPLQNRHSGLDPESRSLCMDSGLRRKDEW